MFHGAGHTCNPGMIFLRTCINAGRKLSSQNTGHVVFGSFLSHLAVNLGYQPNDATTIIPMDGISRSTLYSIGVLRRNAEGNLYLADAVEEAPPAVDVADNI